MTFADDRSPGKNHQEFLFIQGDAGRCSWTDFASTMCFNSLVSMGAHEGGGNGDNVEDQSFEGLSHGIREVRAADRGRRLEEARKKPEMMAARSSVFLGQLEQTLHLQISISVWSLGFDHSHQSVTNTACLSMARGLVKAWLRFVALSQMDRYQSELEQARPGTMLGVLGKPMVRMVLVPSLRSQAVAMA